MTNITFRKDEKALIVRKIQLYFSEELKQQIGQFDAEFLLDFVGQEIGSYFYNRGLYDAQAANCLPVITYDLLDGRYFASRLVGQETPTQYDVPMKKSEFNPATVQAQYLR